jgi:predicted transcriptional regulator
MYSFSKPVNRNELASEINMNASEVGKTLRDLACLGIATLCEERGYYCLTERGREFAILLGHERETRSQELLADLILSRPEWQPIVDFLKTQIHEPFDISELVLLAEKEHDRSWGKGRRTKAERSYRTILEFAGLILISDNGLVSNKTKLIPARLEKPSSNASEYLHSASASKRPRAKTPTDKTLYSRFEMPGIFVIKIKPSREAIDFLRSQLSEESLLLPWLVTIENIVEDTSKQGDT